MFTTDLNFELKILLKIPGSHHSFYLHHDICQKTQVEIFGFRICHQTIRPLQSC